MGNRFVQQGREVRPGQRALVLLRSPGGECEGPFEEAVFAGPARHESRHSWMQREGAEPVRVPDISRFGEKDKATKEQKPGRRARRIDHEAMQTKWQISRRSDQSSQF